MINFFVVQNYEIAWLLIFNFYRMMEYYHVGNQHLTTALIKEFLE
jgi:hypothetical protein